MTDPALLAVLAVEDKINRGFLSYLSSACDQVPGTTQKSPGLREKVFILAHHSKEDSLFWWGKHGGWKVLVLGTDSETEGG